MSISTPLSERMHRGDSRSPTCGRSIKHARSYWLLLAESQLTRRLFAGLLRKITALPVSAG